MQRDPIPLASDLSTRRVLHWVGRVTDEVFSFLGPASKVLSETGAEQTVVLIDDPRYRYLLPRFDPHVDLVLTPEARPRLAAWGAALQAFRHTLQSSTVRTVHLHGVIPCVLGSLVIRSSHKAVALYYSPHGSKSIGTHRWVGSTLLWAVRTLSKGSRQRMIASLTAEATTLSSMTHLAVDVIESPVHGCFFDVPRREARRPLVVAGNRADDPRDAELFGQLAVLLGDEVVQLSFNWIGTADAVSKVRLTAANVGVFDVPQVQERASRLAAGWVYVAPGATRGFPLFIVEAMAAGVPVVAMDTPNHRNVVKDGETGFLCNDEEELLSRVAQLIDAPDLRRRFGQAARDEAWARFSEARFGHSLLACYAMQEA